MAFGVSKEELQKALQELRRDCYAEIKSAEEYKRAAEIYKQTVEEMLRGECEDSSTDDIKAGKGLKPLPTNFHNGIIREYGW